MDKLYTSGVVVCSLEHLKRVKQACWRDASRRDVEGRSRDDHLDCKRVPNLLTKPFGNSYAMENFIFETPYTFFGN